MPARSALRIHSPAGSIPPTISTKMSAPEESISSMLSVQITLGGTQSTLFLATLRLKMWVNSKLSFACWQSSLATERPTVPKPARAIFNFRSAGFLLFLDFSFSAGLDFARFAFAANSSPHSGSGEAFAFLYDGMDYKVFLYRVPGSLCYGWEWD